MHDLMVLSLVASGGVNVDVDLSFLAQIVMFTGFVIVMKPLIFDPLLRLFEERERRTAGAVSEARAMDEQAIMLKQDYDRKYEGVRREAAVDRERLRGEAKQLEGHMMSEARTAANKTMIEGKARVAEEIDRVRHQLEQQRHSLAADIASRVLGREVKQ